MPQQKTIAIIGAGFLGLATAWKLLTPDVQIDIYDPAGINGGASGVSAGLLHPFAGGRAKLKHNGREGMEATQTLIQVSQSHHNQPVVTSKGLLRLATEDDRNDLQALAQLHDDVEWIHGDAVAQLHPALSPAGGVIIHSALTIDPLAYRMGLLRACEAKGAQLIKRKVDNLDELDSYDQVVICAGYFTRQLASTELKAVKGQILELEWPHGIAPLPITVMRKAYLTMTSPSTCIVGATFERGEESEEPSIDKAKERLLPLLEAIAPQLVNAPILSCRAGIRAATPNHLPRVERISERVVFAGGLGSKGLLYHGLLSAQILFATRLLF